MSREKLSVSQYKRLLSTPRIKNKIEWIFVKEKDLTNEKTNIINR